MNGQAQKYSQEAQERAYAQAFLDWLADEEGVNYALRRAKEVFPELKGDEENWDFVARQESSSDWIAIEVKELWYPFLLQEASQYGDFFKQIKSQLDCKLSGTFLVSDLSLPVGDRPYRTNLAQEIAGLVLRTAPSLKVKERKDINTGTMYRFRLSKVSDDGRSVNAMGSTSLYALEPTELEETKKNLRKAVGQLKEARRKGASKCVILLGLRAAEYSAGNVSESISQMTGCLRGAVDEVFLVDIEATTVTRLWPTTSND